MKIVFGRKGCNRTFELLKIDYAAKGYKVNFDYMYYDLQTREGIQEFIKRGYSKVDCESFIKQGEINRFALPIIIEEDSENGR